MSEYSLTWNSFIPPDDDYLFS